MFDICLLAERVCRFVLRSWNPFGLPLAIDRLQQIPAAGPQFLEVFFVAGPIAVELVDDQLAVTIDQQPVQFWFTVRDPPQTEAERGPFGEVVCGTRSGRGGHAIAGVAGRE